jgi:hypothetical protein
MGMITIQVWDATGNKRQEVELPMLGLGDAFPPFVRESPTGAWSRTWPRPGSRREYGVPILVLTAETGRAAWDDQEAHGEPSQAMLERLSLDVLPPGR